VGPFDDPAHGQDREPCIAERSWLSCLHGIMECSNPVITRMMNDLNTNMTRLLDIMRAFPATRAVSVKLF
jgi:hypothetical protein